MKKILITGASGFIGKHLVEKAIQLGFDTYAGIRATSNQEHLKKSQATPLILDFNNSMLMQNILIKHQFDIIIHCAGTTFALSKKAYDQGNYGSLKSLVDAIQNSHTKPEKFIYISSLAAFGPNENHGGKLVSNESTPHPISAYGKSKLKAENYLTQSKLPYIIIRPTAVYGPGDKAFLSLYKAIQRRVEVYTTRKVQKLSFIFISDLTDAIFASLNGPIQTAYFVSDGHEYTISEFYKTIKTILGVKTIRIRFPERVTKWAAYINVFFFKIVGKAPSFNLDKVAELNADSWLCDSTPLQKKLDFTPKYNLYRGLIKTLKDY